MATTAILSALEDEQRGLIDQLSDARQVRRAGRDFWIGHWHGRSVVLALSRIGKVAAATTATTLIEAFGATRIVFTGVAGAIGPDVRVGDVVVASHFVQHDMDASPLFPRFEIPLYRQSQFACDATLTTSLLEACRKALQEHPAGGAGASVPTSPRVHLGLIASGDRFISTAQSALEVQQSLRNGAMEPLAVEMEGAAVAQVCLDYAIAFAAVRAISDRADDLAHMDFQHFVTHVASDYAVRILAYFMQALPTGDAPVADRWAPPI